MMTEPSQIDLLLLPGLDGTGLLFAPLLDFLPAWARPVVISYPTDRVLDYGELLELVRRRLPSRGRYVVVGESFSGPIAIRLAAEMPERLAGLILVATFVSNPVRPIFKALRSLFANRFVCSINPPQWLLRRFLLDDETPLRLVKLVGGAVGDVKGSVLAARIRSVMTVNVSDALRRCRLPILYVAAGRDRVVRDEAVMKILMLKPEIEMVRVDAPHLVLQREPAVAAEAIETFLAGLVPPAPDGGRERG